MLEVCAKGYTKREKEHHWWVFYGAHVYRSLPLGKHGKRENAEVETGQVKSMVRMFGIIACAAREMPSLGFKNVPAEQPTPAQPPKEPLPPPQPKRGRRRR